MKATALGEAINSITAWNLAEGRSKGSNGHGTQPRARSERPTDWFGGLTFNDEVQRARLPKEVHRALRRTVTLGEPLDPASADSIATAMKDWAVGHGATHYTHWFQPLTGVTAEKHDSFLAPTPDGRAIAEFGGKELVRGEPDASSFPSGGMRSTFEARGYTAWDPTSPPWLLVSSNGTTLVIPSAFISWTGEALDRKTPLLRSMEALSRHAVRILKLFGSRAQRVVTTCGPEQEYFLIDRNFYAGRPDLINAGRTLFGARPPKGQEMEDQYFGAIPNRVLACMMEVENELYGCGVPVKTRHNEVAPSQYEFAPIFENANVATDHQMMTMETLKRVAPKYGLAFLSHEKPFAGVNGSGKHLNWSICDDLGNNLLNPGEDPHDNLQFLIFCLAVVRAVDKYQGLVRASVANAGNDHRLGANEAPPAIISVFLGEMLTDIVGQIENGGPKATKNGGMVETGVPLLPKLPRDAGDRNRTSPFAFTGNKFEFRAVGSSQSIAFPAMALNVAVADSLDWIATELEGAVGSGVSLKTAAQGLLRTLVQESRHIIFNGNNYAQEWQEEAERRGLLNLKTSVDAFGELLRPEVIGAFERHKILSERELRAHYDVNVETYCKTVNVEAQLMVLMANRYILPAAIQYQTAVASAVNTTKAAGVNVDELAVLLATLAALVGQLRRRTDRLVAAAAHEGSGDAHARHMRDQVLPAMAALRETGDSLETLVPHELWPLPTYREMLFIK